MCKICERKINSKYIWWILKTMSIHQLISFIKEIAADVYVDKVVKRRISKWKLFCAKRATYKAQERELKNDK